MSANVKAFPAWLLLIAIGVIFFVMGVFSFIDPFSGYYKLVKFLGIGLFCNGVILLTAAVMNRKYVRERKWMQAESILNFVFAVILTFNPLLAFIALPFFLGSWVLLSGLLKASAALALRSLIRGWGYILTIGGLFIVFGLLLLYSPLVRARGISYLIGAFGVIMGILYVVDAFRLRKRDGAVNLML